MQSRSLIFILLFGYFSNSVSVPVQYHHHHYQTNIGPPGSSSSSPSLSSSVSLSSSSSYLSHPYQQARINHHHHIDPSDETLNANENDYETSDGAPAGTAVAYPSSMVAQNHLHNPSSYLNSNRDLLYDQRDTVASDQLNSGIGLDGHQQQSQSYVYQELQKSPSSLYYDSSNSQIQHQETQEHSNSKDGTIGDLYYKKPTVESEYESMKFDIDSSSSASNDYGYQHGEQGTTVTATEYKTGHYIKPQSTKYSSAHYPGTSSVISKPITFTIPQTIPGQESNHGLGLPSIEVPLLEKLIPNNLLKNSNIKFPSIDFNFILGSLFGGKGDPSISFAMPEGAGTLLANLVGHGKPLAINAPDIDIFGNSNSNTKTKIQGFSVPDFLKSGSKFIQGFNVPKIDLSGHHSSGLTLPHMDLSKTQSVGKSPKISAVAPIGPSIHFLRHIPFPSIPRLWLPESLKNLNLKMPKIPKLDLTKIQKKDSLATAEDTLKPTYVTPSIPKGINVPNPVYNTPIAKAIKITKPKKIVTAYPLKKGLLSGHVVIEDYPYGRQQYGPHDDGGEPEIGCAELDKIIQTEPKPIISNGLYGPKRSII